jgi:hypothetical protein
MLGGSMVSWSSKKQACVALLSTEAEYLAGAHAAKETVWLRCLLSELGHDTHQATILHINNQSTIAVACNLEFHDQTKHIDICYHFLRHKVENEEIELQYVPTGNQVADILTKGLVREKHECFAAKMGLCCVG